MKMIKLLDVTLRDGGNRIDFHFNQNDLQHILAPLDRSGMDYIEIGYRNGSIHPIANIGAAGMCAKDYLLSCRSLINKAKIAVMVHPKNITQDDLAELRACGVELLRICVIKGELAEACPLIVMAKQHGLDVSLNFIHASYYRESELDAAVEQACTFYPDMIYFADSNGSLLPTNVHSIYEKYTKHYDIPFGFHAHDNLGLAQANTIAALDAGAHFVDASLSGMGKGIGNLRTEFFIAYLQAIRGKKYNLDHVLPATNYVRRVFETAQEDIEMDEFIRGISDLSTADLKRLKINEKNDTRDVARSSAKIVY